MTPPDAPLVVFPASFVHEGLEDWLFLRGGSNFVTSLYARDSGNLPDTRISLWRDLITARAARCRALGVQCVHMIVPDKLTIYGQFQAQPLVDPDLAPAIRLAEQVAATPFAQNFLDLAALMRAQSLDSALYWKTDTHWTPEGCFLAYKALCDRLGLQAVDELLTRPCQTSDALMDLGGRVKPERWETVRKYNFMQNARRVWSNQVTRYLEDPAYHEEIHVGARVRFENPSAPNQKKLLLIGDSYSSITPDSLTGMLAETVSALEFVWSSGIDWRFVKRRKPDIVVFEIAERFLAILAHDRKPLWLLELQQVWRARQRRKARSRA